MNRILLYLSINVGLLLLAGNVNAQGYNIKVSVKQMPNKEVVLANHYEGKIYVKDTVKLDAQGNGTFKSDKKLWKGVYVLVFSPSNFFDFIVGDTQSFTVIADTNNTIDNIRFEGSEENNVFLTFQKFWRDQYQKNQQIRSEYEKDPKKEDKEVQKSYAKRMEDVEQATNDYVINLRKQYPKMATATFTGMLISPTIPDFSKEVPENTANRDAEIGNKGYFYKKAHYWDYTNLGDSTVMFTPIFKAKLDDYFKNMLIMVPDTVFKACVELIEKARPDKFMYRYMCDFCLDYAYQSKIMGMDEAFVKLGQKYYVNKKLPWVDAKRMKTIEEEVMKRQFNLIGEKAVELKLPTLEGNWVSLYETKAPFTFLLFWEPNCGHCKKQVPLVKKEILDRFKAYGVKVFSVQTHTNKEEWEKFVADNDIFDFINCWDPNRQSNYWTYYNVFSTPVMYLLDKDKKIIAKQLDMEQFVEILKQEFKKQGIEVK